MPWIELKKRDHNCRTDAAFMPPPDEAAKAGADLGSIYECDKVGCGKRYSLQNEQRDGWYWKEVLPIISSGNPPRFPFPRD